MERRNGVVPPGPRPIRAVEFGGKSPGPQFARWPTNAKRTHQAACLNLLTNRVIAWNAVYLTAVIDRPRIDSYPVRHADLANLSPSLYEHIKPYGKYAFDVSEDLGGVRLRPL